MDSLQCFGIGAIREPFGNEVCDLQHFFFLHAARCDGRCADADATGLEDWIGVEWDAVFVYCDAGPVENFLRFFAVQVFRAKIDQHEVVVGAAGNDSITVLADARGERFGIDHYLPLIFAKLRLERFMKANGFCSDNVHQWAALYPGENGGIDLLGEFLFAHNNAAPRPAQTLMCGGGDKMRVRDRTWMLAARNEPGDVRHVDEQKRADRIRNLAQTREIDNTRISRCAGGNHQRSDFFGLFLQRVVIDLLGLFADSVLRHCIKFAGEICWVTMGEMTAVREIHR